MRDRKSKSLPPIGIRRPFVFVVVTPIEVVTVEGRVSEPVSGPAMPQVD